MLRRGKIDFSSTQSNLNEGMKEKEITRIEPCLDVTHLSYLASPTLWLHNRNSYLVDAPLSNLVSLLELKPRGKISPFFRELKTREEVFLFYFYREELVSLNHKESLK